ncbi:snaclec 3 [Cherax quadricarinatus]
MGRLGCLLATVVLSLASSLDASLIFDAADITVTSGESLTLSCGVKQDFHLCFWDHEDRRSFQVDNVHSGVHPGMRAPEDLTDNQCGIVIDSVSVEDSGAWTCRVFLTGRGGELRNSKTVAACHDSFVSLGGGCFHFNEDLWLDWYDARFYCQNLGTSEFTSDLASVDDCDQLTAIRNHIVSEYGPLWHWLGGTDAAQEDNWYWVTGGSVPRDLPFWYPDHPYNNEERNCLYMEKYSGYFWDNDCEEAGPFICEEFPVPLLHK